MDINRIKRLKTFVEGGNNKSSLGDLSERYSEQYNNAISMFDVIINSSRANNIYRDGIAYKAIVDYGNPMKKSELGNINFRTMREIRTRHNDNIRSGSVIDFENKESKELTKFLLLKTVESKEGYDLSVMDKCNHVLKWQTDKCDIKTCDSIVFSRTAYKDDVYPDRIMTIAHGQYEVYVSMNEDTKNLKINDRFFIGKDVYTLSHIDEMTLENVLIFTMNKDKVNKDIDNVELGIADYKECDETPIKPEPSIFEIVISGNPSIRPNQSLTFRATVLENGAETNEIVEWSISNNNAQIININDNNCTLKGLKLGQVNFVAKWGIYEEVKNIEIRDVW